MSATVINLRTGDKDAVAIGNLCAKAKGSMVDAVKYLIEAGQKLTRKKQEVGHGNWLPWLEENEAALGFKHWTATRMMKTSSKYVAGHTFTEAEAVQINKGVWGHTKPKKKRYRQADPVEDEIIALAGQGLASPAIAADVGLDGRAVRHVIERAALVEQTRQDLLEELGVDPKTLSLTAQAKLEVARRMVEHKLDMAHAARMRKIDDEVRQRVLKEGKEYLAMLKAREDEARETVERYQAYANIKKPLFTVDQFKAVLMCLHPDGKRTADKLNEAFLLFNGKKPQLTGEK